MISNLEIRNPIHKGYAIRAIREAVDRCLVLVATSAFEFRKQLSSVTMHPLIARDTVEEKVLQLQESKRNLADAIIGAQNSLNQFNFSYTPNGAEIKHERVSGQSHWLYMFPFDSVDVDVPIDIRFDSLLWHLELQKPNGDLFTSPNVDGLSISLAETENGDKYVFASPDERSRTSVTPQQRIMVHARFERTAFQRWGLTIGVWCAAVVVGVLAGFADTLPTHWVALLVGLLGVSGLNFGVRNAVLGTYKWLPTLASLQGTSIFELCLVVVLALMVIAFLIARK